MPKGIYDRTQRKTKSIPVRADLQAIFACKDHAVSFHEMMWRDKHHDNLWEALLQALKDVRYEEGTAELGIVESDVELEGNSTSDSDSNSDSSSDSDDNESDA